uniref:Uncharacterized protein n=1 Tax=Arundo donax TaxID=35708 RepID=A0A0A8YUP6_ARUDO
MMAITILQFSITTHGFRKCQDQAFRSALVRFRRRQRTGVRSPETTETLRQAEKMTCLKVE